MKLDIIHLIHLQYFILFKFFHQKMGDILINMIQDILGRILLMFIQIFHMKIYIYMIIGYLIHVEEI